MKNIIRIILMTIGIIGMIWFILPVMLYGIISVGNITGFLVALLISIYFGKQNLIHEKFKALWQKRIGKVIICAASVSMIFVVGIVAVETTLMVSYATNSPTEQTTIVILGCKANGENPSLMLLRRLQAAEKYLKANPDVKCVVSGGKGSNETISEAKCMKLWLTRQGIDSERIFMEDKSTNTRENINFSKSIIEENRLCSKITIVTNEFHQYRAGKIAADSGLEHYAVSGASPVVLLPTYYVRELMSIAYEFIR